MKTRPQSLPLTALETVRSPRASRKLAGVLGVLFVLLPPALLLLPWRQNVQAQGRVTALDPMDRNQIIPAPVTGRLVELLVQEGSYVEAGDVLARMADQDPQYALRLEQQMEFARAKVRAAKDMIEFYEQQRQFLETAREQAISSARFALNVAKENERVTERELEAARADAEQKRADFERKKTLLERGVVSQLDYQKAEADYLSAKAKAEAAEAKVAQAVNSRLAKEADVALVASDQQAKIESIKSSREDARSKAALAEKELTEATTKLERQKTQVVNAPRSGYVLRVYAANTADFLTQGSPLIELIPDTRALAAELWVRGIDAPLITPGRKVRLQFEGWPAVQFAGWPSVAVGTFGGVVQSVDAQGGPDGRFRVLVLPGRGGRALAGPPLPAAGRPGERLAAARHRQPGLRVLAEPERLPAVGPQCPRRGSGPGPERQVRRREEAVSRAVVFALCGALLSCSVTPPAPQGPPPPIPLEVYSRFQLDEPESSSPLEPIHVLGQSERADQEGVDAPAAAIELEGRHAFGRAALPVDPRRPGGGGDRRGRAAAGDGGLRHPTEVAGRLRRGGVLPERSRRRVDRAGDALLGHDLRGRIPPRQTGDFAIYDGGKKTNRDGEFRVGVSVPVLQSRTIDPRRVAVWRARIEREKAEPLVLTKRLEATRKAADAYWKWVAAGRVREISVRLLALAETRREQIELAVAEGLLAAINLTENQRLIVDREVGLIRAERLSAGGGHRPCPLYWRNPIGVPVVPSNEALPYEFPQPRETVHVLVAGDEQFALEHRPEVRALMLDLDRLGLDQELARNALLPTLDLGVFASPGHRPGGRHAGRQGGTSSSRRG